MLFDRDRSVFTISSEVGWLVVLLVDSRIGDCTLDESDDCMFDELDD